MEFVLKHWLELLVGIYLAGMMLRGHFRGFFRTAVSMVALIATIIIVKTIMPDVTSFLKQKTPVYSMLETAIEKAVGFEEDQDITTEITIPSYQRQMIEGMNLPEKMKESLIENNNSNVYEILGVGKFTEYLAGYLASVILNAIGFLLMFVVIYALIQVIMNCLDVMTNLPIIGGLNQIAGALLGLIQGLVFLWIACLILTICSGTYIGKEITTQIEQSVWLSCIYRFNFLTPMILKIIQGII